MQYHCVGPDNAVVADVDLTDNFCTRVYRHVITDSGGPPLAVTVADRDLVIYRTISTNYCCWMENDATKVMDAQSASDSNGGGYRNAASDLDKTFTEKSNRLGRDPVHPAPVKEAIND